MAGELVDGLPEGLRAWVEARAEGTGRSRAEVLARAVTVQRTLAEYDGPLPDAPGSDLADRLDGTDARVEAVADEFDEKLIDVRERVIQVKREADARADADHDHPDIRRSAEAATDLAGEVERLRAETADAEARFEAGFDNFEAVVEGLRDDVDDLDRKATTLASALADLHARDGDAGRDGREAAADLKREANRLGVGTASCGHCGGTVRLALLTRSECPHCGGAYEGVTSASGLAGLLGRATLTGEGAETAEDEAAEPTSVDTLGGDG